MALLGGKGGGHISGILLSLHRSEIWPDYRGTPDLWIEWSYKTKREISVCYSSKIYEKLFLYGSLYLKRVFQSPKKDFNYITIIAWAI